MPNTLQVNRLHPSEVMELNMQFNANLESSEESETWLDFESWPEHVSIITEAEMFLNDDLI